MLVYQRVTLAVFIYSPKILNIGAPTDERVLAKELGQKKLYTVCPIVSPMAYIPYYIPMISHDAKMLPFSDS